MSKETILENRAPFLPPDYLVGESRSSFVYGYNDHGVVVKIEKKNRWEGVSFDNLGEVAAYIRHKEREYSNLSRQISEGQGGLSRIALPEVSWVVYQGDAGEITFARTQKLLKESRSFNSLRLSEILSLPAETLASLRDLFILNIDFWKEEHALYDLLGSSNSERNALQKALRQIFPVFFLENVLVGQDGVPAVIDVSVFDDSSCSRDYEMEARRFALLIGSVASLFIVDGILKVRARLDSLQRRKFMFR